MSKKELYVCDNEKCGAILVHPEDGFVITGTIYTSIVASPTILVAATPEDPKSFCFDCTVQMLGPGPAKR